MLQLMMVPFLLSEQSTPISPCSVVAPFPAQHHRRGTDDVSNPLPYAKRNSIQNSHLMVVKIVSFVVDARRLPNPVQKNLHVYAEPCVDKVAVLF